MTCPECSTKMAVIKTMVLPSTTRRLVECPCGVRCETEETVARRLPNASITPITVTGGMGNPPATSNPPATAGQPAGNRSPHYSDSVSDLPSPDPQSNQTPAREPEKPAKPPVFTGMPLAAKGQTWDVPAAFDARVAEAFPAIDRPVEYAKAKAWLFAAAKNRKTAGGMERFLFTWFSNAQDRGKAATVGRPRDTRCAFHLNWSNHLRKPPGGWYAECPECKEARAAMGDRKGDPTRTVDLVAATEAKLARDRAVRLPSADEMAELREARGT